jgi:hypothetical protein
MLDPVLVIDEEESARRAKVVRRSFLETKQVMLMIDRRLARMRPRRLAVLACLLGLVFFASLSFQIFQRIKSCVFLLRIAGDGGGCSNE